MRGQHQRNAFRHHTTSTLAMLFQSAILQCMRCTRVMTSLSNSQHRTRYTLVRRLKHSIRKSKLSTSTRRRTMSTFPQGTVYTQTTRTQSTFRLRSGNRSKWNPSRTAQRGTRNWNCLLTHHFQWSKLHKRQNLLLQSSKNTFPQSKQCTPLSSRRKRWANTSLPGTTGTRSMHQRRSTAPACT